MVPCLDLAADPCAFRRKGYSEGLPEPQQVHSPRQGEVDYLINESL